MIEPTAEKQSAALDAALMAAHERRDFRKLTQLYHEAALHKRQQGDEDAACFLLTQAYVFALECGHPLADALHLELKANGRES